MVAFNKQRVQYDEDTKRIIAEEYINTRQSMAQVASKYNLNVNTVNNIVKKYKAQKKKEDQFFRENAIQNKPKHKQYDPPKRPLNVAQEVNRIEQTRKIVQTKPVYEPPKKPQNELRKSAKRETIIINTSQGVPAEPFRPRPPKSKDENIIFNKTEKKLDRRNSLVNIVEDLHKRTFGQ